MLTEEKVSVFKNYKGYYDGYYIQNRDKARIVSDEEWSFLSNLIQDLFLVRTGVASKSYEEKIINSARANCDSEETLRSIFELEKYLNGSADGRSAAN